MLLARTLDEKMASLYRGGKIHGGVFLGRGQESYSVALGMALREGDVWAPLVRDLAGRLAFGESILDVVRTFMGSVHGPMRGRDGNVHRGRLNQGMLPMISHLGAMVSVVNGILFARRLKKQSGHVGCASLGDGGTSTGAFHEAVNQAAVEGLPLVLVIANNQYAYSTPNEREFACDDLADRAAGYGIRGYSIQGNDLKQCLETVKLAVQRARAGEGPQMVVAKLLRLCGHGEHDDAAYISPTLAEADAGQDCLSVTEASLLKEGWVEAREVVDWKAETVNQVEDAVAQVQREPAPDPFAEDWSALASKSLCDTYAGQAEEEDAGGSAGQ